MSHVFIITFCSLRCESILNLKLYTMRDMKYRDIHNTVNDYFSKVGIDILAKYASM